jgi:hypothetical protein
VEEICHPHPNPLIYGKNSFTLTSILSGRGRESHPHPDPLPSREREIKEMIFQRERVIKARVFHRVRVIMEGGSRGSLQTELVIKKSPYPPPFLKRDKRGIFQNPESRPGPNHTFIPLCKRGNEGDFLPASPAV